MQKRNEITFNPYCLKIIRINKNYIKRTKAIANASHQNRVHCKYTDNVQNYLAI